MPQSKIMLPQYLKCNLYLKLSYIDLGTLGFEPKTEELEV